MTIVNVYENFPVLDSTVVDSLRELEMFEELASEFLRDLPERLEAIRTAFTTDSRDALEDAAHTLKGSSLAIGATRLGEISSQLQHQAPMATLEERERLVCRIELETNVLKEALRVVVGNKNKIDEAAGSAGDSR